MYLRFSNLLFFPLWPIISHCLDLEDIDHAFITITDAISIFLHRTMLPCCMLHICWKFPRSFKFSVCVWKWTVWWWVRIIGATYACLLTKTLSSQWHSKCVLCSIVHVHVLLCSCHLRESRWIKLTLVALVWVSDWVSHQSFRADRASFRKVRAFTWY